MHWNFDESAQREGTNCVKYDLRKEVFGKKDLIPLWVADMDFIAPRFITEALAGRLKHKVYGYSFRPEEYFASVVDWNRKRHEWHIEKEWITFCPGVVPALNICTLAFTNENDSVIVQPPVYFPFFPAVESHNRKLIHNQLTESEGTWKMDFDNLKRSLGKGPRMIIISNPHNPVGRVWTADELKELVDICYDNNILIISDEIHCDLVLPGYSHTPLASLSEKAAGITVTCIAPSKTFNLAGLSTSNVIISNHDLRNTFKSYLDKLHISGGNIFGTTASIAAYSNGHEWVDELLLYLNDNVNFVTDYFTRNIPGIIPVRPEATYLMWLDCRSLGMKGKDLGRFFAEKAGVGMNEGSSFGPGGEGFMRLNLGCPRSILAKALVQIENAVNAL